MFNLVPQALPGTGICSLRGIINITASYILSAMEQGTSFDSALDYAQNLGLAEAAPYLDLDGWDAAAKFSILI